MEGNPGYYGYINLNIEHSGISQLTKDGVDYAFNHRNNPENNNSLEYSEYLYIWYLPDFIINIIKSYSK